MSNPSKSDIFAKGMTAYAGTESETTPTYDRWQHRLFKNFLGPRILEVGAGCGRITNLIITEGTFHELLVSEPSPHFFDLLRTRVLQDRNVRLVQATTSELVAEYSGHFDSVFSVHVLEHIEDDLTALKEQVQLVRPGGNVIVLVPAIQFLYSDLDKNIGHFRRYTKARFYELAKDLPTVAIERMFYSNAVGVLGSLYFSKFRKITYQGSDANLQSFVRLYKFFSERIVPCIELVESRLPVPIGLNLTCVLGKNG